MKNIIIKLLIASLITVTGLQQKAYATENKFNLHYGNTEQQVAQGTSTDELTKHIKKYTTDYKEYPSQTNLPINKSWLITFNEKLDDETVNKNTVKVIDSEGKEVPGFNCDVYFLSSKKLVITAPPWGYKEGETYAFIVTRGVRSWDNTSLSKDMVMKFTITGTKPEVPKPKDDIHPIFHTENIEELISTNKVSIPYDKEVVYFNVGDNKEYLPKTTLNSDINSQIYRLLEAHLKDNTRNNYANIGFSVPTQYDDLKSRLVVLSEQYTKWKPLLIWRYYLYEDTTLNEYNAPIELQIQVLADYDSPEYLYDEYYGERLEESLKALYPDYGSEMYKFIYEKYMYMMNNARKYPGEYSQGKFCFTETQKYGNTTMIVDLNEVLRFTVYFK